MRLLRLDLGDVAVGVGDLRDGLLVVALRGEGVLHPLGVAAAVRPRDLRGAYAVRTASNSKKRPPTSIIPGDESRRWREGDAESAPGTRTPLF